MGEWNEYVQQWLIEPGWCDSGGLASVEDGSLYAAAPEDKMWQSVYDVEVENDNFEMVSKNVEEPKLLYEVCTKKSGVKGGLWLAGVKYTFVKTDNIDGFDVVVFAKNKGGLFVVLTGNGSAVLATFDENQEMTSGNCCESAMGFAKYLAEQGY